nr:immunoglobulin light chain junction region [Macaca mulatta]
CEADHGTGSSFVYVF